MSTTTNFKRIALVAVAALGLGVLSSVPTTAAINADSVTLSSPTASQTTAETYTATSAVVTVSFFGAGNALIGGDSMSITAALTGAPAGNTALPTLRLTETSSAFVDSTSAAAGSRLIGETITANRAAVVQARSSSVVTTAKFAVYLTEAAANGSTAPTVAGTYTVKITPATVNSSGALQGSAAQTLTITVTDAPTLVKTASSVKAYIQPTANADVVGTVSDSVVAISKSNAPASVQAAFIGIAQLNAAGSASSDSLTVEITGAGTLGSGLATAAARGRNLTVKVSDSVTVWSDGNAGVGTITIKSSTSGALLATKTVTFTDVFSKFAKETAAVAILGTSARNAVTFVVQDSVSNTLSALAAGTTLTAFSSDATIATAGAVTYSNDSGTVSVTGVKAGTVTITIGNGTTLALSTIKSAPVTVRVGSTSIASVKVSFDKASYSIGEKALITVTPLDSLGLPTVPSALANTFAAGLALKEDKLFSQNALLVDSTTVTFADATSATAGTTAGSATYTVYMPLTSGTVKVTGTLGTAVATAIQATTVTASATVTDSGSAALAAVTALATTVASLRTLIVTLTNLVLKIQKKVKA